MTLRQHCNLHDQQKAHPSRAPNPPPRVLTDEGISFGIFAFLASNMFPSTAIPQPFAVQNFLRNMAGPHGNVLGALGTGPGGLVVTKTASQWLANPSGVGVWGCIVYIVWCGVLQWQ